MQACHQNAEKLLMAAKATAIPGSYHIAYHLAVLALEEIGKSSLIFMDALNPRPETDEERRSPMKWVDDHERKLFWAIWLPQRHDLADWQSIPEALEMARDIHERRLNTLYVDPSNVNADSISEERGQRLISATEARLNIERLKEFNDLEPEKQELLQWFFIASEDPQLRPMIFSKGSFDTRQRHSRKSNTGLTTVAGTMVRARVNMGREYGGTGG